MNVVINNIVTLNPGDAAILMGSIRVLNASREEGVEVDVFDRQGEAATSHYPWARIQSSLFSPRPRNAFLEWLQRRRYRHWVLRWDAWRFRKASGLLNSPLPFLARILTTLEERCRIQTYLDADVVVCSGGTYLVDHYNLLLPTLELELTLALGKPLVFFPQSMGPFQTTIFRNRMRDIFDQASHILVRDSQSRTNLIELGVSTEKIEECPDAAWALTRLTPKHLGQQTERTRPRVAVSVREWRYYQSESPEEQQDRYLTAVAAATTAMVRKRNAEVVFISTCQGVPEYWTDDASTAERVVSRLPTEVAGKVKIDRTFRQPEELIETLGDFDCVIATRMHMGILAFCAGVPVLGIAYEFKTRELFESMGLHDWVVDIDEIDAADFAPLCERFLDQLISLRASLRKPIREKTRAVYRAGNLVAALADPEHRHREPLTKSQRKGDR